MSEADLRHNQEYIAPVIQDQAARIAELEQLAENYRMNANKWMDLCEAARNELKAQKLRATVYTQIKKVRQSRARLVGLVRALAAVRILSQENIDAAYADLQADRDEARQARANAEMNGARWYGDLEEARDALATAEIVLMESEPVAEGIEQLRQQRDTAQRKLSDAMTANDQYTTLVQVLIELTGADSHDGIVETVAGWKTKLAALHSFAGVRVLLQAILDQAYPPNTVVCSDRDDADIGAQLTAAARKVLEAETEARRYKYAMGAVLMSGALDDKTAAWLREQGNDFMARYEAMEKELAEAKASLLDFQENDRLNRVTR